MSCPADTWRRAGSGGRWVGRAVALAAMGLAILAACGHPAGAPVPAAAASPVTQTQPAWKVRAPGGQEPIDPGTTQLALLDAQECSLCHGDEHAEWATSRHGLAWTNGIFQREFSAQPRAWCINCHAPLTAQQAGLVQGDVTLANQGVSCAACHVRAGALVSRRRQAGSPHQTVEDPTFGSPQMCADCHQFTFPVLRPKDGVAVRMSEHPMQSTVAEFLAGPRAEAPRGCLTCHGSRHGHAFRGGHDLGMLQRAIVATWCRKDADVIVEVANVGAGHRVPTGDIHRHLLARVWRSTAPESTFEAFFGRRFRPASDGGKETIWDSSLSPGQRRRFTVPVTSLDASEAPAAPAFEDPALSILAAAPPAPEEPINLEVTYVYTVDEVPRAGRSPGEPVTAQILHQRLLFSELPACALPPVAGAAPAPPVR